MTSEEIIRGSRERFKELQQERPSFEQDTFDHVMFLVDRGIIKVEKPELLQNSIDYFCQQTKSLHWRSFYLGWLESRVDYEKGKNI